MRRKMSFKKTATLALSLACAVTATAGAVSLKGASADSGYADESDQDGRERRRHEF